MLGEVSGCFNLSLCMFVAIWIARHVHTMFPFLSTTVPSSVGCTLLFLAASTQSLLHARVDIKSVSLQYLDAKYAQ